VNAAARVVWLQETTSTNDAARAAAEAGETGPLWIAAHRQTAGRGRRGRAWTGLEGNLFATGLFTFDAGPAAVANLSFAAALAVAETCDQSVNPARVRVKWPNDVLIDGAKTSGVLLESWAAPAGGLHLAVGIGINVAAAPEGTETPATALIHHARADAPALTAPTALAHLARRFAHWVAVWEAEGFAPLRTAWLDRATGLGGQARARLADRTIEGRFEGLSETGALCLRTTGGDLVEISAGDVFFPD
jgi:BirA family biotin operon repressor/biotin-[acetyl-CoA-carboxylase] ligase